MRLGKLQILPKNHKFCQNHQKLTNVGFCDNSFNKSLVLILKYTVCTFYDCMTVFEKNKTILNLKEKNGKK